MNPGEIRKALMERGATLIFAKQLSEKHQVGSCRAVTFDRRKGFHVVERKPKQIRSAAEREGGIYLVTLKNDKVLPVTEFQEQCITSLPEEDELLEALLQKLPRYDFTVQVQSQSLLKKIGFFR